ncbi:lycopene cyclase domain-containing protein [Microbacterium sp. M28]|uniref:lycopene cyclase domain-containing protein n=1 Tax=Microbacterium sp. M28 TaxID=2962064 RepID=UPI0021F4AE70|nr:lycopene cyclase domain-containing protein [Microbacterium sp. M28]UYO97960.1 lycopene cyclase domain-containing protein [Microbacterium sp. M28]
MGIVYLLALFASLGCILLVDRRFRLFFWKDAVSALVVTLAGLAFFLIWDAAGIALGIFLRGDSPLATGILLAPELPLEEPVFLVFLVVCTMVLYTGAARLLERPRAEDSA